MAEATSGRTSPPNVLMRPKPATTSKVGMMRTSTGSMRVRKMSQKAAMRSGKRKKATA